MKTRTIYFSTIMISIILSSCGLKNDGAKTELNLEEISSSNGRGPGSIGPNNNGPTILIQSSLLQNKKTVKGNRDYIRKSFIRIFGNSVSDVLDDNINPFPNAHGGATDLYLANKNNNNQFEFPERSMLSNNDSLSFIPDKNVPDSVVQEGKIINSCITIINTKQTAVNSLFASLNINTSMPLDRAKLESLHQKFYPIEDLTDHHWNLAVQLQNEYNDNQKTWKKMLFLNCMSPFWKIL